MPSDAEIAAFVQALTEGSRNLMSGFNAIFEAQQERRRLQEEIEKIRIQEKSEQLKKWVDVLKESASGDISPTALRAMGEALGGTAYAESLKLMANALEDVNRIDAQAYVNALDAITGMIPQDQLSAEQRQYLTQKVQEMRNRLVSDPSGVKREAAELIKFAGKSPSVVVNTYKPTPTPGQIFGQNIGRRLADMQVRLDEKFIQEAQDAAKSAEKVLADYSHLKLEEGFVSGRVGERAGDILTFLNTLDSIAPGVSEGLLRKEFISSLKNTALLQKILRSGGLRNLPKYGLTPTSDRDLQYVSPLYEAIGEGTQGVILTAIYIVSDARRARRVNDIVQQANRALTRYDIEGYQALIQKAKEIASSNPFLYSTVEERRYIKENTGIDPWEIIPKPMEHAEEEKSEIDELSLKPDPEPQPGMHIIPPGYRGKLKTDATKVGAIVNAVERGDMTKMQAAAIAAYNKFKKSPPRTIEEYLGVLDQSASPMHLDTRQLEHEFISSLAPYGAGIITGEGETYTLSQLQSLSDRVKLAKVLAATIAWRLTFPTDVAAKIANRLVEKANITAEDVNNYIESGGKK